MAMLHPGWWTPRERPCDPKRHGCGIRFIATHPQQVRCTTCQAAYEREYNAKKAKRYREKKRAKKIEWSSAERENQ